MYIFIFKQPYIASNTVLNGLRLLTTCFFKTIMFSFVMFSFVDVLFISGAKVLKVFPLIKYFWPIYLSLCDRHNFTFRIAFPAKEIWKDQSSISLSKRGGSYYVLFDWYLSYWTNNFWNFVLLYKPLEMTTEHKIAGNVSIFLGCFYTTDY